MKLRRMRVKDMDGHDLTKAIARQLISGYGVMQIEHDPSTHEVFFTRGSGNYAQIRADGEGPCEVLWRGRLADYEDSSEWFGDHEEGKDLRDLSVDEYLERLENIIEAYDVSGILGVLPENAEFIMPD